jgi:hypothetical protein
MRLNLLLLFIAALMLSGCLTPATPQVPEWVQHPPDATANELYGVSVAATPAEALVSATGGIATSILNTAKPQLAKTQFADALREKIVSEMKTVLETMDYSAITVKEHVAMGKDTAVLIAMQRSGFAAQMNTRLEKHSEAIKQQLTEAGNDDFTRLCRLGSLNEDQPRLLAEIFLLETLNPAADTSAYRMLSKQVNDSYNRLKFGMGVNIISDANAIVFVHTLNKALRSEGLNPSGKPSGTILLYADSEQEHSGGGYSVKTRLRIESTVKGKKIMEKEHYLQASSPDGYADARRKTGDALMQIIKQEGLFHTLGF